MTDPHLLWRLRPGVDLTFLDQHVSTDASGLRNPSSASTARTVLVVGDSTPFGWLVADEQTFAARLAPMLAGDRAGGAWRVVNAGVPGYSSFQVRQRVGELLEELRPEALVVALGNNDAAPAPASDLEVAERRRWSAAFESATRVSHFATWLRERLSPKPPFFVPGSWDGRARRVSAAELADNVRAIIAAARERGTRVVLLAPPVNLFAPPSGVSALANAAEVEAWCRAVIAQLNAGEVEPSLAQIDARLAGDPRAFYARWLRGLALIKGGDTNAGEREIEQAFEDDPFSDRAPSSYRQALARVAAAEQIPFVDTNSILRGPPEAPLAQKFADHCHPDASGHEAIARALAPLIAP